MVPDNDKSKKQQARAELREGFLRSVSELQGQPCNILTYEKSTLEATFSVWKPDGTEVLVNDLKTPANLIMQSAILRTPDILAFTFNVPATQ
ncbi:unnamed protein product [Colias eurytheme]|nr:unnamed protein product [Colias eurytheme]